MKIGKPLVIVCLAGVLGGSYALLPEKEANRVKRALDHLVEGDLAQADHTLSSAGSSSTALLYRGYLKQLRGQYEEAELLFQRASQLTTEEKASVDCLLAQASNAYLRGEDPEISPLIDRARHFSQHPYLPFFEGLSSYLGGHYSLARDHWLSFEPMRESNQWFESVFQRLFSPGWVQIHLAHCLTEEGNFNGARERLEKQLHLLGSQEEALHTLATRLLGLTYLKEAEGLPLTDKGSYYKLARFYLERGSWAPQFTRERAIVVAALQKTAGNLLTVPELMQWGIAFTHTLQDWQEHGALSAVAKRFVAGVVEKPQPTLCVQVRNEFQGTPFLKDISEAMLGALQQTLKTGSSKDLSALWQAAQSLSSAPQVLQERVAAMTVEEIFRNVARDDARLSRTLRYLNFWKELESDPLKMTRFARGLLQQGEVLWQNEGQEKKGKRLMELALSLTNEPEKKQLKKEMEQFRAN